MSYETPRGHWVMTIDLVGAPEDEADALMSAVADRCVDYEPRTGCER